MHVIIKIVSFFIGLFIVANGAWLYLMLPTGDELTGIMIIVAGILIPVITLYISGIDEKREA
jgi:hypothetical protein